MPAAVGFKWLKRRSESRLHQLGDLQFEPFEPHYTQRTKRNLAARLDETVLAMAERVDEVEKLRRGASPSLSPVWVFGDSAERLESYQDLAALIDVDTPEMVLVVGQAGAGKTAFLRKLFAEAARDRELLSNPQQVLLGDLSRWRRRWPASRRDLNRLIVESTRPYCDDYGEISAIRTAVASALLFVDGLDHFDAPDELLETVSTFQLRGRGGAMILACNEGQAVKLIALFGKVSIVSSASDLTCFRSIDETLFEKELQRISSPLTDRFRKALKMDLQRAHGISTTQLADSFLQERLKECSLTEAANARRWLSTIARLLQTDSVDAIPAASPSRTYFWLVSLADEPASITRRERFIASLIGGSSVGIWYLLAWIVGGNFFGLWKVILMFVLLGGALAGWGFQSIKPRLIQRPSLAEAGRRLAQSVGVVAGLIAAAYLAWFLLEKSGSLLWPRGGDWSFTVFFGVPLAILFGVTFFLSGITRTYTFESASIDHAYRSSRRAAGGVFFLSFLAIIILSMMTVVFTESNGIMFALYSLPAALAAALNCGGGFSLRQRSIRQMLVADGSWPPPALVTPFLDWAIDQEILVPGVTPGSLAFLHPVLQERLASERWRPPL